MVVVNMKTLKDIKSMYDVGEEKPLILWYTSDDLRYVAKQNIKQLEKEMKNLEEIEREQYLFLAGKRAMYVEFFNIDANGVKTILLKHI